MAASVLFMPDYGEANPYQPLLAGALHDRGFHVTMASGSGPLPVLGAFWRQGRPDVVHLHWLHPYLVGRGPVTTLLKGGRFIAELLVLRLLGVTLVWTVHNRLEHDRRAPRTEAALKHAVLWLVGAGVIHCGAAEAAIARTYRLTRRQRAKLHVVPHGHYVDWYPGDHARATARRALGLPDHATVFLYFGRIQPYKNLPALIEAFRSLSADTARLLLVGAPRDEAIAERLIEASGDDERIRRVFEYVPEDAVGQYVAAADAVVLPYRDVLTSGSAVLAASFKRAIVAPRRGCIADRFDDGTGLIYDPVDDSLGAALERALAVDLDRIGRGNFERVCEPDWPTIARLTGAVYDAAGRGGRTVASPY